MNLHRPEAEWFVPDGTAPPAAFERVTHLGVGAHHDDLEFMALHGILECHRHAEGRWFGGVTCTDGAGSVRTGPYAAIPPAELRRIRRAEQRAAASIGDYACLFQLDYPSDTIRFGPNPALVADLETILRATRPTILYTHNPADKHDSHVAVVAAVLAAIRRLPDAGRPTRVLGCEVWRGLDWMNDAEKTALETGGSPHLAAALAGVFDSQIAGGKRYDLATAGRRLANATFLDPRAADAARELVFAMDLTPLARDPSLDPVAYALGFIDRFRADVEARLRTAFQPHTGG